MYGIRLIGTDKWLLRVPGYYHVRDGAGSTWSTPPIIDGRYYCVDLEEHILNTHGGTPSAASAKFYANPAAFLEVKKVEFVALSQL